MPQGSMAESDGVGRHLTPKTGPDEFLKFR